jgi:3-oxoadipate enol-lactonase / 4-carboxymuconolactone decarboxylase
VAEKYFTVGSVATLVHHRGPTTLPGRPPAPSDGSTILCIHDVAGNGHVFAGVLDALADGHRPIAFDLPAHGRSGGLDSLASIDAMAAHTKALADRLELTAPVLVGDGMGAAVVLEAAASWPGWPGALVVCGGASMTPAPDAAAIDQVRLVTAGRARRQFDTSGYAPGTAREVFERAFGEWMKTDPRATVGDLEALAAWDGRARVGAISAPVVAVVGGHEPADARSAAEALAAAVADGRVVALKGAGCRGVLERPEQLAAIVADVAAAVAV